MITGIKKKKGFTLIELLCVIGVLGLIFTIVYVGIIRNINGAKENISKSNERLILTAAEDYTNEYKNTKSWKNNIDKDGNIEFCVSLKSLINYGFYNAKTKNIDELKDKYAIYVRGNNGVYDYKLIPLNIENNVCSVTKFVSDIEFTDSFITITDENNIEMLEIGYSLDKYEDGKYKFNINLKNILNIEEVTDIYTVYVAVILDISGSMNGNKLDNAKNAAINLSKQIIDNKLIEDNSYVSLVLYNSKPLIKREFKHEYLTDSDFDSAYGGTNTSGGIDAAISLFKGINTSDKVMKYTILLYDGEPNIYSRLYYNNKFIDSNNPLYFDNFDINKLSSGDCGAFCNDYINNSVNYLKNTINSNLITFGYDFNGTDSLKEISTIDNDFCSDSNYNKDSNSYCYYEGASDSIYQIFSNLSNKINREVNKASASKIKVNVKFNDKLEIESLEDNELNYEFDLTKEEVSYNQDYIIQINTECSDEMCELDLFDSTSSITLELYNENNELINTITSSNSPKINVGKNTFSIIN